MRMEDYVVAPDGVDLDGNVHIERDGDDGEEEAEEVEDEKNEDEEEEVVVVDEDEEEDKDEDDGKEPRTIGEGEMVNTSADEVGTMVDDQPIVLRQQVQEMREYTPWLQPPAPAPRPNTP
jgi:predicted TIM-barrel fold metal-dependent hydrolase